jgi:uncharacterized protein
MAANQFFENQQSVERSRELVFAGDNVCLSGQIDYPLSASPHEGFPLLFILHHAGSEDREWYSSFAQIALQCGYAVFRWDKRGTGRSGAGGGGSTTQDAVNAYEIALEQPFIDHYRTVILAQGAGTALLGSSYGLFARIQSPYGVILASNMLDEEAILAIDTRVEIVMGEGDWNPWEKYGEAACESHNHAYRHGASFYFIPNADRKLMDLQDNTLHLEAGGVIKYWLQSLCPLSDSI